MKEKVVIGTRGSKLALWQARWVKKELSRENPGISIEVEVIKTKGDSRYDLSPEDFGSEGIFTAELDRALIEGRIQMAVHSLKDLPTGLPQGLCLPALTERASVTDILILSKEVADQIPGNEKDVSIESLKKLRGPLKVGSASLRRAALLRHGFPCMEFMPIRGNLDTRVAKLSDGDFHAIVVAEAGLSRLGLELGDNRAIPVTLDWYLPAAGQGSLAVETADQGRAREIAAGIDHKPTREAVTAERAAMSALGAGCRVPAGFLGTIRENRINLKGVVAHPRGEPLVMAEVDAPLHDPDAAGAALADKLLSMGAAEVLGEVRGGEVSGAHS